MTGANNFSREQLNDLGREVLIALGLERYIGQQIVVHTRHGDMVVDPVESFLTHEVCAHYALPLVLGWKESTGEEHVQDTEALRGPVNDILGTSDATRPE